MNIPPKVPPRFFAKVRKTDACWEWIGCRQSSGYGMIGWDHSVYLAHRVSYAMHVGPIPPGHQIDHLCRNRLCVNPAHLEAVTPRENTARSANPVGVVLRTGRCQRGHDMTDPANLRNGGNGRTHCRACQRKSRARVFVRYAVSRLTAMLDTPHPTD